MTTRIAVVGASLTESDPLRQPGYPWYVERLIQHRGMPNAVVRTFARDGADIYQIREMGSVVGLPSPFGGPGSVGAKIYGWTPTDLWIGGDLAINAAVFPNSRSEAEAEADAASFVADLTQALPGLVTTYVRLIPPEPFAYNGASYDYRATNWAVYDAALAAICSNRVLTIDYGLVAQARRALSMPDFIDGIHEVHGASEIFAAMVYDGMPALYPELQTSAYGPFEDATAFCNAIINVSDPNHALAVATSQAVGFSS
jgi:hypothetical protein